MKYFLTVLLFCGLGGIWWYSTKKTTPVQMLEKADYSGIQVPRVLIEDLAEGHGEPAVSGEEIDIFYSLWIYDPKRLENKGSLISASTDIPVKLKVGSGTFVTGFEEGIVGMKPEGKRRLIIPPSKGYGDHNVQNIPGGTHLLVEVTRK